MVEIGFRTVCTMRIKGQERPLAIIVGVEVHNDDLCFYDFERTHMLNGKFIKKKPNIWVFRMEKNPFKNDIIIEPLTLEVFDKWFRPAFAPDMSVRLKTLDDVCFWYRKQAHIT